MDNQRVKKKPNIFFQFMINLEWRKFSFYYNFFLYFIDWYQISILSLYRRKMNLFYRVYINFLSNNIVYITADISIKANIECLSDFVFFYCITITFRNQFLQIFFPVYHSRIFDLNLTHLKSSFSLYQYNVF